MPLDARTRVCKDSKDWDLVFSDEFNAEGPTFYPGMDQFWEAVDIHYAATEDLELYDPDATFTKEGTLHLMMDTFRSHDLLYRSGCSRSGTRCVSLKEFLRFPQSSQDLHTLPGCGPVSGCLGTLHALVISRRQTECGLTLTMSAMQESRQTDHRPMGSQAYRARGCTCKTYGPE